MRRKSGPDAGERWFSWREQRLLQAGFPPALARVLGRDRRVDVHALLDLTDRGCPPELAARIVAPLEGRPC